VRPLGGIGVKINGNDAYFYYVSPTQVKVLAPADSSAGPISVTVTNAAETSAANPSDVIDIYGTGFGTTKDSVDISTVSPAPIPHRRPAHSIRRAAQNRRLTPFATPRSR
jgi:hypothetical protein